MRVTALEPCPVIESGRGRVVLSTITHEDSRLLRLSLEGQREPLELTYGHPLHSADRGGWAEVLGAGPQERSKERRGCANGFKNKTVNSRLGKLCF